EDAAHGVLVARRPAERARLGQVLFGALVRAFAEREPGPQREALADAAHVAELSAQLQALAREPRRGLGIAAQGRVRHELVECLGGTPAIASRAEQREALGPRVARGPELAAPLVVAGEVEQRSRQVPG